MRTFQPWQNLLRGSRTHNLRKDKMKPSCFMLGSSSSILALILCWSTGNLGQETGAKSSPPPGPMLNQGIEAYDTPDFTLGLVRSSQTIAFLQPKGGHGFDFTPGDPAGTITERVLSYRRSHPPLAFGRLGGLDELFNRHSACARATPASIRGYLSQCRPCGDTARRHSARDR